ncbi:MAG TPA: FMN-binding protein [Anaerovoracaceae bacterium]|nr:FMN-binding protein [Anaerovoracaceae bacterium]
MKSNNAFKEYVAPIVVLVAICMAVTFALAATYGVTKPIIEENTARAADAARAELLSKADAFTVYDGELVETVPEQVFVTASHVADNNCGMVVTVKSKSFGGLLTTMIGIDDAGAITGIKITDHADTPGLGTKAMTIEHLSQYDGLSELNSNLVKEDTEVEHISGASISSGAVHEAVYCALEQFKEMGGVN